MSSNQLTSCLHHEIALLKQLQQLLAIEKNSLVARDYAALEELSLKKQDLSTTLESAARERMALIGTTPNNPDPKEALLAFLKTCSTEQVSAINQLNAELAEQLTLCREQNLVNGQVIAANLHLRREIIGELNNQPANLYTSNGSVQVQDNADRHQEV